MRQFVESLGRLYATRKIGEELIRNLFADNKINQEEMEYILSCE